MTLRPVLLCIRSILWRRARYCSASNAPGVSRLTKCSSTPAGISVGAGAVAVRVTRVRTGGCGDVLTGLTFAADACLDSLRSRWACSRAWWNLFIAEPASGASGPALGRSSSNHLSPSRCEPATLRRPGYELVGSGADAVPFRPPYSFAVLQVCDGLFRDLVADPTHLVGIGDQEAVVAQRVDETRDTARMTRDGSDGAGREEIGVRAPDTRSRVRM